LLRALARADVHYLLPTLYTSPPAVLPSKLFDAGAALAAMTAQSATALVATAEQASALSAALAADAAAPAGKRKYDLSTLRTGLVGACSYLGAAAGRGWRVGRTHDDDDERMTIATPRRLVAPALPSTGVAAGSSAPVVVGKATLRPVRLATLPAATAFSA